MKNIFYLLIILVVFMSSCTKEKYDKGNEDIPFLIEQLDLDNGDYCYIKSPIIEGDNLILMIESADGEKGWINCYDKNTLELKWHWQDAFDNYGNGALGFGHISHIYDGIICIAQINLSYGIDVSSGQTIWHNRDIQGESFISGSKEIITSTTYQTWDEDKSVRIANIYEGEWDTIYTMVKNDSLKVDFRPTYHFSYQGTEFLCFVSTRWGVGPHVEHSWLNLYNLSQNQMVWTSDTIPLTHNLSPLPGSAPRFEDGQIILANDAVYSYNIEDGSLEWWKSYDNYFTGTCAPITGDGKVYANNHSGYMVALDVHNGQEIFNITTGSSPGKLIYNDGKVYASRMVSFEDGLTYLMAIDGQTGEKLFNETAPYIDSENGEYPHFDYPVTVDPETGYMYVSDQQRLLVYDFD